MFQRSLRAPRNLVLIRNPPKQPFSSQSPPPRSPQPRIERFNRRLPRFLHRYTNALAAAPVTHITSFLVLHEITAIVPLLGLAATFHYTHWLPSWFAEGTWVLYGVEKFGRYFKRKGWIRSDDAVEAEREVQVELRTRDKAWNIGEGGVRVVVEFATAYAITKALLPLRIILSVWATPWFARRTVIPATNATKRLFGRSRSKAAGVAGSGAAGPGAVDAGAVPRRGVGKGKSG
ncbi:hypothetical protein K469DRAFT_718792 [Zopfia rhizophila CBS 207.26]|uniref:Uncharacterized protein n=1 Tax=Zopfia rhizophila CBS 207.26 TaxID=1314779 RepID=A0A6A6EPE2_9PEZI|nr:hypothetical protein K469DRAFT_718792 [Zopfia rhizophila CBS 207.26]